VNETKILAIDIREIVDIKAFLMRPCPKGVQIQCTIKRDRSGIMNRFYPKYHCFLSVNAYKLYKSTAWATILDECKKEIYQ
jgi:hypothetical protein